MEIASDPRIRNCKLPPFKYPSRGAPTFAHVSNKGQRALEYGDKSEKRKPQGSHIG